MGRLVLLQTSPRVAAGLLTAEAWDVLRSAEAVLGPEDGSDLEAPLAAAGIAVRRVADPVAALLGGAAGAAGTARFVVWLCPDDDAQGARVAEALAAEVVARAERGGGGPDVEVLTGSYDLPGARLLDMVEVMDRLRTGCPWDREQTHESLVRYLVEESYETVEAIETGDRDHLREELGDLLLQVMFHSRIAAEHPDDPWTVDDVAAGIVEKLVRRHPHVFAGLDVAGVDEVATNWEEIKAVEKQRASVLDGIPTGMPALALAEKVLARAGASGLDAATGQQEPQAEPTGDRGGTGATAPDDVGERLLALVREARARDIDPEQALREAVRHLSARIQAAESR